MEFAPTETWQGRDSLREISRTDVAPRGEGDVQHWSESWSRFDFNASYRMKLLNRATNFSLVVRNFTARECRVDRDTFTTNYRFNDPREWSLSSRFKF